MPLLVELEIIGVKFQKGHQFVRLSGCHDLSSSSGQAFSRERFARARRVENAQRRAVKFPRHFDGDAKIQVVDSACRKRVDERPSEGALARTVDHDRDCAAE